MAEKHLYVEGYGNFPITEHEAERLEAGKSITLNIFKPDHAPEYMARDLFADKANEEKVVYSKAEGLRRVHIDNGMNPAADPKKLWEAMDDVIRHERDYNYPRSLHHRGEAIMDPDWAKLTLDERLTVNTDPARSEKSLSGLAKELDSDGREKLRKHPIFGARPTTEIVDETLKDDYDPVDRPAHYTEDREIEPIDVIDDWTLGFYEGQVLKYIARAGRKTYSELEDLRKAKFYLDRLVELVKKDEGEE